MKIAPCCFTYDSILEATILHIASPSAFIDIFYETDTNLCRVHSLKDVFID